MNNNNIECSISNNEINQNNLLGQTPLHLAASHGRSYETVQLLLMHPFINPKLKNKNGDTAVEIAQRSSRFYNIFDAIDPLLDYKNIE